MNQKNDKHASSKRDAVFLLEQYPDVLTIDDVCAILRVARKTVYALVRSGDLPSRRLGRLYRISKHHMIAYLENAA